MSNSTPSTSASSFLQIKTPVITATVAESATVVAPLSRPVANDPATVVGGSGSRNSQSNSRISHQPPSRRGSWEGRTLGEYLIGPLIGSGGNGQVYRAIHRWLERDVAIKFLLDIQADDAQAVERFRREAQVAAHLIHPGIVRATDGGTVGSEVFLVTDLVQGKDLASVVRQRPMGVGSSGLPIADVCQIGLQLANALQFIADRGVVHRDIKPSNIMLDRDGTVKLLDLGLARSQQHGQTMTSSGQVMGTIDYMAPEQASDPRRVNHLADMYSLGCTLYYLLVGRAPLDTAMHETVAAKIMATMEMDADPIQNHRRDLPANVATLIHRMMEKDPLRRPQSFTAVAAELAAMARGSNLVSLLEASPNFTQANGISQTYTDSIVDKAADALEKAFLYSMLLLAVAIGFVEAEPHVRPGQRKRYRFSLKWLKPLMVIGCLIGLLWLMGIQFVPIDSDMPMESY